jgi:hypothetical protein
MLGGLSRWLRAAGYDARFEACIADGELVRRAGEDGLVLLSSDGPIFDRTLVRSGAVRALCVPRHLDVDGQLAYVLRALRIDLAEPRCMGCGGELMAVPKDSVRGEAPPRTYSHCSRFWRCSRCQQLFWQGTHWQHIERRLLAAVASHESVADTHDVR